MRLLFVVIFASICVSALNGQLRVKLSRYGIASRGVLDPFFDEWNGIDEEENNPWADLERLHYMSDNVIDATNYGKAYNADRNVKFITLSEFIRANPQVLSPQPVQPLSDPYNELNEIVGIDSRFADNSGYNRYDVTALSARPFKGVNVFEKVYPRNEVKLISAEQIASKPFRTATLASIGYGPNHRFY